MFIVWSPNSAYEAGAKIGRNVPDPWIDERELKRLVLGQLRPSFKPRRSQAEANAESASGAAVTAVFLAIVACAAAVLVILPDWLPSIVPDARAWGATVLPAGVPGLIAAGLVVLAILACFSAVRSRRRAREVRTSLHRQLAEHAYRGAAEAVNRRRAREDRRSAEAARAEARRQRRDPAGARVAPLVHESYAEVYPLPEPRTGEVTPLDAEELAAEWMRHMGEPSATTTQASWDGGIDVAGHFYIAQVKHFSSNIGSKAIREFAGVVAGDPRGRKGLYFTSTGYASGAVDFATSVGLALFRYNAWEGTLDALNPPAEQLRHGGLGVRR
jgi:hypothetical protein